MLQGLMKMKGKEVSSKHVWWSE